MNKHYFLILLLIIIILPLIFSINYNYIEKYRGVIPLNIFQTWHTKDLPPKMLEAVNDVKEHNPEFSYHLYDEVDCLHFINTHFDKSVSDAYNSLVPHAYKADLWRYCVLYIHGGVYLDIKYYPVNGFKFLELTDQEYFAKDIEPNGGGIYNAILITKPNNTKLLNCIHKIVENVKNKFYGSSIFEPTGPLLLKQEFSENDIKNMRLYIGENNCPTKTCIELDNKPILAIYNKYYSKRNNKNDLPNYHDLWMDRKIYKNNP